MAHKIQINNIQYSKTSLLNRWSIITKTLPLDTKLSGDDFYFIDAILKQIPQYEKIVSKGSNYFYISSKKKFQGKAVSGITLVTTSGKKIWLGKAKIVNLLFNVVPAEVPTRVKALAALRLIIKPQMDTFRRSVNRQLKSSTRYKVRCSITKELLNFGEFHIDHKYPFKCLVEDWCQANHVDLDTLDVYCRGTKCFLKNTELAESFFDYHLIHAELQPTTIKANLSKGSKII